MMIMAQTFRWSDTRIAAYLKAEGEKILAAQVPEYLQTAYELLESEIPSDIRLLYCDTPAEAVLSQWTPSLATV